MLYSNEMKVCMTENFEEMDAEEKVWYVAYGADLCSEEFKYYIDKCTNKEYPEKEEPYLLNYGLYYSGYDKTSRWEYKGLAYLRNNVSGFSFGKAYMVTIGQLLEIYKIKKEEYDPSADIPSKFSIIDLGAKDRVPVYTITETRYSEFHAPSREYLDCIIKGVKSMYSDIDDTAVKVYAYYHAISGWCLDNLDRLLEYTQRDCDNMYLYNAYQKDQSQMDSLFDDIGIFESLYVEENGESEFKGVYVSPEMRKAVDMIFLFKKLDALRMGYHDKNQVKNPKYFAQMYRKPICVNLNYGELEAAQDPEYYCMNNLFHYSTIDMAIGDESFFCSTDSREDYIKDMIKNIVSEYPEDIEAATVYASVLGLTEEELLMLSSIRYIPNGVNIADIDGFYKPSIYNMKHFIDFIDVLRNSLGLIKVTRDKSIISEKIDDDRIITVNKDNLEITDNIIMYLLLSPVYNILFASTMIENIEDVEFDRKYWREKEEYYLD